MLVRNIPLQLGYSRALSVGCTTGYSGTKFEIVAISTEPNAKTGNKSISEQRTRKAGGWVSLLYRTRNKITN